MGRGIPMVFGLDLKEGWKSKRRLRSGQVKGEPKSSCKSKEKRLSRKKSMIESVGSCKEVRKGED